MSSIKKKLRAKTRWGVIGIFVLLLATVIFDAPNLFNGWVESINNKTGIGIPMVLDKEFALGLDLQGGAHLVYQADVSQIDVEDRGDAVEGVRDVIERRVNAIGVGEPNVQTTKVGEDYRVIVELPGVTDIQEAKDKIGETPILEFKKENIIPPRELTEEERIEMDEFNKIARKKAEGYLTEIKNGTDFEEFAEQNSEDELSRNNGGYLGFISSVGPYADLYSWASSVSDGSVSQELLETNQGFAIAKRGGSTDGDMEVRASHILICYLGASRCEGANYTKTEALAKAQKIFEQANADNFADLAIQWSTDPGSKENGGDLGFFPKEAMVGDFGEASFNASVGEIVGPVETQYGFHIIYKTDEKINQNIEAWYLVVSTKSELDILPPQDPWMNTGLSGKQLERAEVVSNPNTGAVQVSLQFDSEGTELFKNITTENVGKPIAIYLDGEPISIPRVNEPITDGSAVISGSFNITEAGLLSQRLNAGALPVPVEIISQQTVGATLGIESMQKSLKAAAIAIVLVMIFMIVYYRIPGLISVISLSLYISLTLALFKLIGVTLTLAGIAGFVLSIGMAVDANVLIFERLKEELKLGKSLKTATEEGFIRAWSSIRDGNISTLITCALLIMLGTSFVKGFAITLGIGIFVSLFTAITVTRVLLRYIAPWFKEKGNMLFLGYRPNKDAK
ncbi:MAG: protein translocase subunit SecD [Candidatus Magasanikbacteria bacterium]|nr:protein translocase subunit SecD [Candidatus Magasanikbacteria bacterium]